MSEWHQLRTESGEIIPNAPLPGMEQFVELLFEDGHSTIGHRIKGLDDSLRCWCWETATGWIVAGHPQLVGWRPSEFAPCLQADVSQATAPDFVVSGPDEPQLALTLWEGSDEVFSVSIEGRVTRAGRDVTCDDFAIADAFRAWVKLHAGIEVQRPLTDLLRKTLELPEDSHYADVLVAVKSLCDELRDARRALAVVSHERCET